MTQNLARMNTIAKLTRRRKSPMRDAVMAVLPGMAAEFTVNDVTAAVRKTYRSRTAVGGLESPVGTILSALVGAGLLQRSAVRGTKRQKKYVYRKAMPGGADRLEQREPLTPPSSKEQAWKDLRASMVIKALED